MWRNLKALTRAATMSFARACDDGADKRFVSHACLSLGLLAF